jgi:hypothetical protein
MAGQSRPKDGVASARLCPAIHVFVTGAQQDVDARHKAGHDERKSAGVAEVVGARLPPLWQRNVRSRLSPATWICCRTASATLAC